MGIVKRITALFRRETEGTSPTTVPEQQPSVVDSPLRRGEQPLWYRPMGAAGAVATVYRCVRFLSESVAALPLQYMRYRDGIFVDQPQDRLTYLMNVQPDAAYTGFDMWRQAVVQILTKGAALIIPVRDFALGSADISRLVLCGPGTWDHDTTLDTYHVSDEINGIFGDFNEEDVIHIKGLTLESDPKRGVSVLSYARMATTTAIAGDEEARDRFENAGTPRSIVSNDKSARGGFGDYLDEELKSAALDIEEQFRVRRIAYAPGQVDVKQVSMSSADMQFLESRKFTVLEICRFFGVHPSFVFSDTTTNYKSAEMANVAFLTNTLNPLLRSIERELHRKLVPANLWYRYKFEFDRRSLYACDLAGRMTFIEKSIATGTATVNEMRRMENRPAVEGGDAVFVSANLRNITETDKPTNSQTDAEEGN